MAEQGENELLELIYKNAEMGRDGLYYVLRKTDDTAFRKLVETQLMEYQSIMDEAEDKLRQNGRTARGVAGWEKATVRTTAACKTAMDSTPPALADMLIQGSAMGVTKIMRKITRLGNASEEVTALATRLRKTEENNIEQMKQYL